MLLVLRADAAEDRQHDESDERDFLPPEGEDDAHTGAVEHQHREVGRAVDQADGCGDAGENAALGEQQQHPAGRHEVRDRERRLKDERGQLRASEGIAQHHHERHGDDRRADGADQCDAERQPQRAQKRRIGEHVDVVVERPVPQSDRREVPEALSDPDDHAASEEEADHEQRWRQHEGDSVPPGETRASRTRIAPMLLAVGVGRSPERPTPTAAVTTRARCRSSPAPSPRPSRPVVRAVHARRGRQRTGWRHRARTRRAGLARPPARSPGPS